MDKFMYKVTVRRTGDGIMPDLWMIDCAWSDKSRLEHEKKKVIEITRYR